MDEASFPCVRWRRDNDAKSYPRRRLHKHSSIPRRRRFLRRGTWSSLDNAWCGLARLRFDTIRLRDDRFPAKEPHANALSNSDVASGRLARSARYPIYLDQIVLIALAKFAELPCIGKIFLQPPLGVFMQLH